jgi:hypothetical protein
LKLEFSATLSRLGEERNRDEGEQIFGRAEGVHHQAGRRRNAGCGDLPESGDPTDKKRLKQLEDETARLKKIVADLTLDREMLQDVIRRKLVRQWA